LEENLFAEMVVSKDKAKASITVMCPLCRPNSECIRIYPKGLDEKATYFVKEMNLTKTGGTLMNVGLIIWLPLGDFQTRTFTLKKV
jgi:alpha-galactosidase